MAHKYGTPRMARKGMSSGHKKGGYKAVGAIKSHKSTKYSGAISKKSGSSHSY